LNGKIDARVNGIMLTLTTRVDGAKTAVDTLNWRLKELETEERPHKQPYWEAKEDLDHEKELLDLLKAKIEADKADAAISKWIPVKVIDPAVPPKTPSGPNRELGGGLLICGLATAVFGFYSLRQANIREESKPNPV
jgi:uncharacterized protein involved in exopolysaccharide biosynthesis